jgi:hypothetical protein
MGTMMINDDSQNDDLKVMANKRIIYQASRL